MVFQKISPAGTSTILQFAGDVVNKLSDWLSGTNIAASDATNKPDIATETRFRTGMLRLWDNDRSHSFYFDTSAVNVVEDKKVKVPALAAAEDELLFATQPAIVTGKTIDYTTNTILNLPVPGVGAGGAYNYFVYIDTGDANRIKARNGFTGAIQFQHNTDAGAVIKQCVDALPITGGMIRLAAGTFNCTGDIYVKNYVSIVGSGMNVTIIRLANSANKDVMMANPTFDTMTANRPTNGYFNEAGVIHDVTLQDFSIDGNKANNSGGRFGLSKIGYAWNLTNICVYNCKSAGIYSEWGTQAGCPDSGDPTKRCMEDYWVNVYVHHNDQQGILFRGPHDTMMTNILAWGNGSNAVSFDASGTIYAGGCQVNGYHCFAPLNTNTIMTYVATTVTMTNAAIEGGTGTSGMGVLVTGGARFTLKGAKVFANDTGIKIDAGIGYSDIDAEFHDNVHGIKCFGVQNKITGYFHDNTVTDILLGEAGGAASYNDIRAKCTRTPTALNWAHASNAQNYVDLSVVMLAGHVALTGTPRIGDNHVSIWAIDATGSQIPANTMPFLPTSVFPSYKKWGALNGVATSSGDGLWGYTFPVVGSASGQGDATDGRFVRYTSGTGAADNAGIRIDTPITIRGWNARMRIKFRISNTDVRLFLGWKGNAAADPAGDDSLNGDPGFYFGKVASTSSWQVMRNDGSGATVTSNVSGNPAPNTSIHTVDFWTDGGGYGLRLDNGADNYFTTEVPSSSHFMAIVFQIENTSGAARNLDIFYAEIIQDK
jgi:hypothetical protein